MKALILLLLMACSEDPKVLPDGGGATDSGSNDAAAPADASAADAAPADAEAPDADVPDGDTPDADAPDAEPADAQADAGGDGGVPCVGLGKACTTEPDCEPEHDCVMNVCIPPARPECGGFVGAQCPPAFPECLFYAGADVGPCFTTAELACICASPEGRAAFGCP